MDQFNVEQFINAYLKRDTAWQLSASCLGLWEHFDLDEKREKDVPAAKRRSLKRICDSCPVKQECLEDTLLFSEEHTYRAGLMPSERKRLMTKLGIPSWDQKLKLLRSGRR